MAIEGGEGLRGEAYLIGGGTGRPSAPSARASSAPLHPVPCRRSSGRCRRLPDLRCCAPAEVGNFHHRYRLQTPRQGLGRETSRHTPSRSVARSSPSDQRSLQLQKRRKGALLSRARADPGRPRQSTRLRGASGGGRATAWLAGGTVAPAALSRPGAAGALNRDHRTAGVRAGESGGGDGGARREGGIMVRVVARNAVARVTVDPGQQEAAATHRVDGRERAARGGSLRRTGRESGRGRRERGRRRLEDDSRGKTRPRRRGARAFLRATRGGEPEKGAGERDSSASRCGRLRSTHERPRRSGRTARQARRHADDGLILCSTKREAERDAAQPTWQSDDDRCPSFSAR